MSCLGILRRKEDRAATEVYMLNLNPHEFTHPATNFINDLKHQLVFVAVNTVEEALELISGQVAYDLAKTFVPLGGFPFFIADGGNRIVAIFHFHAIVKSGRFINLRCH